ncbi:hypothetical protein GCM10017752_00600 [Streptomyces roseoviridis]
MRVRRVGPGAPSHAARRGRHAPLPRRDRGGTRGPPRRSGEWPGYGTALTDAVRIPEEFEHAGNRTTETLPLQVTAALADSRRPCVTALNANRVALCAEDGARAAGQDRHAVRST